MARENDTKCQSRRSRVTTYGSTACSFTTGSGRPRAVPAVEWSHQTAAGKAETVTICPSQTLFASPSLGHPCVTWSPGTRNAGAGGVRPHTQGSGFSFAKLNDFQRGDVWRWLEMFLVFGICVLPA